MENVIHLMSLIDANSEKIRDGDYLEMCNTINSLHKQMSNKGNCDSIHVEHENLLHDQVMMIEKIKDKMKRIKTRTRLSPGMKMEAIKEFSIVMGLHSIREYTEAAIYEQTNLNIRDIYNWYMDEYNKRQKCKLLYYSNVIQEFRDKRNEIINLICN